MSLPCTPYLWASMIVSVLFVSILLFVLYSILIIYYAISWRSIPNFKLLTATEPRTTFSIIIPARNEAQNIQACLQAICSQHFPTALYEVLVVDDFSTDNTSGIVKNFPAKNVRLISLAELTGHQQINSYKKKAIETAIAQATGEVIITTDADCTAPPNWLHTIDVFYRQTTAAFIVMPVRYTCCNNFLEIFQALDFITLQGITGASVHKHMHSMCNGANLAYTKKAFEDVKGFEGIDSIASGDDMLLMHKIYTLQPHKVFFLKSTEVIVQTQPMKTLKDFFNQRIRWASKADKYDDKRIFAVLLLVYLFNVCMLILPLISIFHYSPFIIHHSPFTIHYSLFTLWLLLLAGKTMVELFFLYPVANFFNEKKLLWWFPVAQPFHVCYTVVAGWLGKFGHYQWKGRSVK